MPKNHDTEPRDAFTLRSVCDEDLDFLRDVYASTREDELANAGLDPRKCKVFTDMQFAAQSADYRRRFPDAHHDVILLGAEPIGRIYVARTDAEIRILDVSLLPNHRGSGYGSSLIKRLLDEARDSGKRVRIFLDNSSSAVRLFERLGFVRIERQDLVSLYDWLSPNP